MQSIHVPRLGPAYWVLICFASVLGANIGDFVSRDLHGGHWRGLLPLLLVFGAILWAERRSKRPTELFYWLCIITVRTAATNLADLTTHDARVPYLPAVIGLGILLAAIVALATRRGVAASQFPATDNVYWLGMLVAGTLGTAMGDGTADAIGLGVALGTGVLGLITLLLLGLRTRAALAVPATYWLCVVGVRAAGTTAGDWSAHTLGLEWSTLASAVIFVLALAVLGQHRAAAASPAEA